MNLNEEVQSEEDCYPTEIIPGESFTCIFDMNHLGDKRLKVFVSEALNEGLDVKPSDNILNVVSEVVAGEINPRKIPEVAAENPVINLRNDLLASFFSSICFFIYRTRIRY